MEPHNSRPYNPDLANVFYRAGYIEHWGRGIRRICDACEELGAALPVYELRGNDLRVHFAALQSALFKAPIVSPKVQHDTLDDTLDDTLEEKILAQLKKNPSVTQKELAKDFNLSVLTIKRAMKGLQEKERIVRKGGKRYGYWEILR